VRGVKASGPGPFAQFPQADSDGALRIRISGRRTTQLCIFVARPVVANAARISAHHTTHLCIFVARSFLGTARPIGIPAISASAAASVIALGLSDARRFLQFPLPISAGTATDGAESPGEGSGPPPAMPAKCCREATDWKMDTMPILVRKGRQVWITALLRPVKRSSFMPRACHDPTTWLEAGVA
jgi:hypothetical protein